jgi:diguanylate cyclase (GGDEF)-like protein/PAS domain S-box-containing protein
MPNILPISISEALSDRKIPILVVDDARDNLDLMEALLLSAGYENIFLALSGAEALATLANHPGIGLVLLDMMMPGMDGHQVCRRIAESKEWGHIPVIIVTGAALLRNEALCKSFGAGAIDFISKPINEVELFARIHSALTLYQERVMRRSKARELAESEEKFRVTFDQAPVGIAHVALNGKISMANQRLCDMLGYQCDELLGFVFDQLFEPKSRIAHQSCVAELLERPASYQAVELPLVHRQNRNVWTQLTVSPLRETTGKAKYLIYVVEDISERKLAEDGLRLAAAVFDSSTEAIIITDANAGIVKVNRAFTEITGYRSEEVIGRNPRLLSSGRHDASFYAAMWSNLADAGQWEGEILNRRKSGEIYPSWLTLCAVKNDKGITTNYVGISVDITMRKATEERLSFLANHDALTQLPNRILFSDRLQHAMARAQRDALVMAILFLDLDQFKDINDTFGHTMGDSLLQSVGNRLLRHTRESDTLARWGGDEFILLLESIHSAEETALVAQRTLEVFAEPFRLDGHEISVTSSIGISLYPRDGHDVQALLRNADTAMYCAKESGRNNYQFYASEMQKMVPKRLHLNFDSSSERRDSLSGGGQAPRNQLGEGRDHTSDSDTTSPAGKPSPKTHSFS